MPRLALAASLCLLVGCVDVLGLDSFSTTSAGRTGGAPLTGGAAGVSAGSAGASGSRAGAAGDGGGAGESGAGGEGGAGQGGESGRSGQSGSAGSAGQSGESGSSGQGGAVGGQGGAGGQVSCGAGEVACSDGCKPSDEHNCGTCGEVCARRTYCDGVACVPLTVEQIVASDLCTCARYSGGQVLCWGDRSCHGRGGEDIGDNETVLASEPGAPPPFVKLSGKASQLVAGPRQICAVLDVASGADKAVRCWGDNIDGLGTESSLPSPIKLTGINGASIFSMALGDGMACLQLTDDHSKIACYGSNKGHTLGYPDEIDPLTSSAALGRSGVQLLNGLSMVSWSAGNLHVCAGVDNVVRCWGDNGSRQLGYLTYDPSLTPMQQPVAVVGAVSEIKAGGQSSAALVTKQKTPQLWTWGANPSGLLGRGSAEPVLTPGPVTFPAGVVPTHAGTWRGEHMCAVVDQGRFSCWGAGKDGALGYQDTTDRAAPGDPVPLAGVVEIATGLRHTCARTVGSEPGDTGVRCWGSNDEGQLGSGKKLKPLFDDNPPLDLFPDWGTH